MRGYFSKIAQQSGVRSANQRGVLATRSSDSAPLPPRIDRHDVLMITPDPATAGPIAQPRVEKTAMPTLQEVPVGGSRSRVDPVAPPKEPVRIVDAGRNLKDPPGESHKPKSETARLVDTHPPRAELEDPVRLEVSDATDLIQPTSEPQLERAEAEPRLEHFVETAKIISGREVSRDDARSILVREIHEWIADGPPDPATHAEPVVRRDDTLQKPEQVEVVEREPGVVRIGGELMTKTRQEIEPRTENVRSVPESTSIHERTLDLSIGSITVVIEGDPTPPQLVKEPASRQSDTGNEILRGPSRLRRSYI